MDVLRCLVTLFGILTVIAAQYPIDDQSTMKKCIECEHIMANRDAATENSALASFYSLLDRKFNLACANDDPFDRDETDWKTEMLRSQGAYIPPFHTGILIDTVPCQDLLPWNRCNYIVGTAKVELPHYNYEVVDLEVVIRGCKYEDPTVENVCYDRDSNLGNSDLLNFFQIKLSFLGQITVKRFTGRQCFCQTNKCRPLIAGSSRTSGYIVGLILALLALILL